MRSYSKLLFPTLLLSLLSVCCFPAEDADGSSPTQQMNEISLEREELLNKEEQQALLNKEIKQMIPEELLTKWEYLKAKKKKHKKKLVVGIASLGLLVAWLLWPESKGGIVSKKDRRKKPLSFSNQCQVVVLDFDASTDEYIVRSISNNQLIENNSQEMIKVSRQIVEQSTTIRNMLADCAALSPFSQQLENLKLFHVGYKAFETLIPFMSLAAENKGITTFSLVKKMRKKISKNPIDPQELNNVLQVANYLDLSKGLMNALTEHYACCYYKEKIAKSTFEQLCGDLQDYVRRQYYLKFKKIMDERDFNLSIQDYLDFEGECGEIYIDGPDSTIRAFWSKKFAYGISKIRALCFKWLNLTSIDGLKNIPNIDSFDAISLSINKIRHIPKGAFHKCANLRFLDLSENRIGRLPSEMLYGLRSLEVFLLDRNNLKTIPADLFNYSKCLHNIVLSNNKIASIPQAALNRLAKRSNNLIKLDNLYNNLGSYSDCINAYNNLTPSEKIFFDDRCYNAVDLSFNRLTKHEKESITKILCPPNWPVLLL